MISAFIVSMILFFAVRTNAQDVPPPISIGVDDIDTTFNRSSSDDSLNKKTDLSALGIELSPDAIDDIVKTSAKDSARIDVKNAHFYLYGNATVEYQKYYIEAGEVNFSQSSGIINALPHRDSTGKIISIQTFKDEKETFNFDELAFNFNNKKAIVKNARMQYGEGFVLSEQVKRNPDESIFGYKNLYTTCELDHPHFGIRANKIKVIPGKVIASGPANLEFEGIGTPLFLPFGIFPIQDKQTSGFIMPSYTMEGRRGLGLQRGGYYLNVNEYVGSTVLLDIFSKGSYGIFNETQYNNRYRYSGRLELGYNFTKTGESFDANALQSSDFTVRWSHQMDPKARPGTNFNASVNIVSQNYNKLNSTDMNQMLNNTFSSNISYSKNWVGKPFNLTAALRHDQNTQSRLVTVTLPEVSFNVSQFNPFQFRKNVVDARWYEKITTSYNTRLKNSISFYDSNFNIRQINPNDFNNAIVHDLNLSANYNVFRYFNLSFNVPYTEYWNTKQFLQYYNEDLAQTDTMLNSGFYATRQFSASSNISTRIYGVKMFKKGKIMGIRHVVMPSIGLTYQPGFAHAPYNYFEYIRPNANDPYDYYSPYSNYQYNPFGGPSNANNRGSIDLSINNTLAVKMRGTDSTNNQNVNILDRFSISTNYNMFADSNKLAPINLAASTRYKEYINMSASAQFNPYKFINNRMTKDYLYDLGEGLAKFHRGMVSVGLNYRAKKDNQKEHDDKMEEDDQYQRLMSNGGYDQYYDFNVPFDVYLNYSLNAARNYARSDNGEIILNHSMTFGGQFNLTENWRVSFDSGYNFNLKEMSLTTINISRDLHCWQMILNVVPFGTYRSFNFTLNVKSTILQDLKLIKRRSFFDN